MVFPRFLWITVALTVIASAVSAHSVHEVETMLRGKEKYFQPLDRTAPDFSLLDMAGRTVGLADLGGKVVVLNFVYIGCTDVCPLHAERIAEIQSMVNQTPMREMVRFITVTTDPKNDVPDLMRDYGPAHGLDPANWTFLTSGSGRPEDATRRLAEAYGLKFTRTGDTYQMHAVVTHVIDQSGRLRARFHGLRFAPVNLVVYLNSLTNEAQGPHEHGNPGLLGRLRSLFR